MHFIKSSEFKEGDISFELSYERKMNQLLHKRVMHLVNVCKKRRSTSLPTEKQFLEEKRVLRARSKQNNKILSHSEQVALVNRLSLPKTVNSEK